MTTVPKLRQFLGTLASGTRPVIDRRTFFQGAGHLLAVPLIGSRFLGSADSTTGPEWEAMADRAQVSNEPSAFCCIDVVIGHPSDLEELPEDLRRWCLDLIWSIDREWELSQTDLPDA